MFVVSSQTGFAVTAKFCRGFSIEDALLLVLLPVVEKKEQKQKQKHHVYAV